MSKNHRAGKKISKSHTTVIPAAGVLVDAARKSSYVDKIATGVIKAGLKGVGGKKRAKATECPGGLIISVRDNTSHQKFRIYTDHQKDVIADLEKAAVKNHIILTADKRDQ